MTNQSGQDSGMDKFLNEEDQKLTPNPPDVNAITLNDVIPPAPLIPPPPSHLGSDTRPRARDYRTKGKTINRPVSLDLSELMIPPITRRGIAIYETLQEAKFDHRVIEGDKAIPPPPISLPPTYPLFDRGEQDFARATKLMKNVVRSTTVQVRNPVTQQMEPQVAEQLDYVEFINGQKTVDIQSQFILYVWLENHPLNESNKWRDQNKKSLFRRTDFEHKSSHQRMVHMDLQREAEEHVIRLDKAKLIALASAMTNPQVPTMNVPIDELRYNMRLRARQNPEEVLFKSPDKKAQIRMSVVSALDLNILEFIPEKNSYFLGLDPEPIHEVALDANPLDDLVAFFNTPEGAPVFRTIEEDYLSFWK